MSSDGSSGGSGGNGVHRIEFGIELTSPIKQDRFNGQEREKELKQRPHAEQAEAHAYRCGNGNVAVPAMWIYHGVLDAYYQMAGKTKTQAQTFAASRIQVQPALLDTGQPGYEIDVASAPAGSTFRGGTRDTFVKPRIDSARVGGVLVTSLPAKEVRERLEFVGENIGIGSDRKHGYGRFKITDWRVVN